MVFRLCLQEVQRQASLFSLYSEVLSAIPSLVVTLMVVAYSDRGGRKLAIILPLVGTLAYTLALLSVSYFELNVYILVGCTLISALCGGLGTFLGGCFAYIADLSEDGQQKTLRIAGLDSMIGLLSGVAALSTGYFLKVAGFNWPFLTSAVCQVFILLYAIFILEETVKQPPPDAANLGESQQRWAMQQMFYGVYQMFAGASPKRRALLILLMLIFNSFCFTYMGGISLFVLYELNEPLCWTEILIGYGTALFTAIFLSSFMGVAAFTYCGTPQLLIVLMGILSVAMGMVMMAFSKTTLMVFLARVPMLLSIMPYAVLRSMMSKIIPKSEQGEHPLKRHVCRLYQKYSCCTRTYSRLSFSCMCRRPVRLPGLSGGADVQRVGGGLQQLVRGHGGVVSWFCLLAVRGTLLDPHVAAGGGVRDRTGRD
uniref:solute carrier family 46 member 3 n=1 Tax=Doryrhamphus excisus TaxID=161450 RepID=UPI0025AE5CA2|nr:solute carrier family 46 member 3 [Doryrhamphus excisus]